jgi:drug/metabolite transporter (DMT)-like permease
LTQRAQFLSRLAIERGRPLYEKVALVLLSGALYSIGIANVSVASRFIPPATLASFRLITASVFFAGLLPLLKPTFQWRVRKLVDITVVGLLNIGLPFLFLARSLDYISSSLAAVIFNTTPLFTIVLAHYLLPKEKLSAVKILGTLIGIGGAVMLIASNQSGLTGVRDQGWIGQILIIAASIVGALGVIYTRMRLQKENTFVLSAGQVFGSLIVIFPLAVAGDGLTSLPVYPWQAWAAVFVSAASGPFLSLLLLVYMVKKYSATLGGFATIATPVFSAAIGVLLLGEVITMPIALGVVLVVAGIGIVNAL